MEYWDGFPQLKRVSRADLIFCEREYFLSPTIALSLPPLSQP